MVNGVTSGVLTRLDVLDNFPSIKICTAYETDDGRTLTTLPASSVVLSKVQARVRRGRRLARADERLRARGTTCRRRRSDYIRRIEKLIGIPIDIVSVGPERDQAIIVHDVLKVKPRR